MKILFLCSDIGIPVLGQGGGSAHVRGLTAALDRAGHSVVLVTPRLVRSPWEKPATINASLIHLLPSKDNEDVILYLKEFVQMLGIENSRISTELRRILYNKELFSQVKRACKSERPDFIYERASLYSTAGVLLAREFEVPLILELNAPLALEQVSYRATSFTDLAAQMEKWVVAQAHVIVTVSSQLRDHVITLGVDPERVHTIPNGVDPNVFRPDRRGPALRERWRLGDGPIIGFVGGIRPWHGVRILPQLLQRLASKYRGLRLVIVGDGPLRAELESEIERRNLSARCVLTGSLPQEEVAQLIPAFDVALAPYPRLGHAFYFSPLKLFEYMACGVPVVAAGLGQITEVLRSGETGLIYPPDDVDSLVAACTQLLDDPALRERLGTSAATEVRERYTWDHNATRVVALAHAAIHEPEEVYV